ncbi:Nucleoporin, partial [Nosema granulosis]
PQQPFASSTPQSSNPFGTSSQSTTFSNNSTLNSSNFSNTINCNPTNTMNYNPTNMNPSSNFTTNTFNTFTVNYEDPFLLKDITFEKVEKKTAPFSRIVPKPIFSEATMKPLLNLTYRPPRVTQKKKIYTEPSIEEARHLKEIENLVIGFEGKGRIQYIDKISGTELTTSNIEDKITFLKNEVVVSDPPGIGLNKRARVYVEGIFAFSKSQGDFIVGKAEKYPLKAIQERFVYSLKEDPYKKFVDYNYETGLYVYEVNHF